MSSKCAPFSIRNRIESTPMSSLLRWPFCWIERWRRNSSRYNWTSPLKKHGNRCEPCALSTSTLAMAREKDLSPRVALAPSESCDFSTSTIATRTPERRTTRLHSDTFRNVFHSFQSFSGHTRKHGLDSCCRQKSSPFVCRGLSTVRRKEIQSHVIKTFARSRPHQAHRGTGNSEGWHHHSRHCQGKITGR